MKTLATLRSNDRRRQEMTSNRFSNGRADVKNQIITIFVEFEPGIQFNHLTARVGRSWLMALVSRIDTRAKALVPIWLTCANNQLRPTLAV